MSVELPQVIDNNGDSLVEQGRRIRALHAIISRPDLSFDQQIDATLRLGCQLLGTEVGKVGRQDPENNTSEFLNTVVMSELPARRGMVLPLDKTFCQVTFASPQAIAISHVDESDYKDHPAAKFLGMQSYIGCSINVHGKKFGTVNFSNRRPVSKPFTEADIDLVNLIGSWISTMMERQLEAEELKQSKEAAESANQAKSAFLANMSHEIRTPLTAIIGFAEAALDPDQGLAQRIEALRTIHNSSSHLLHLINEILDFSKIESQALDIEKAPLNLSQLVREVESIIAGQAKAKQLDFGIDFQLPLPKLIYSDALRLKQILLNLCSNAVKFTDSGSVQIRLNYNVADDTLMFSVKDSGIGISPEQLGQLFQPFKQADSSISRKYGGTGLGLSLSKRLAELLDAELSVSSEPGLGSEFHLLLQHAQAGIEPKVLVTRLDEPQSDKSSRQESITETQLSGNILLAEDNQMIQDLVRRFLEKYPVQLTFVDNGAQAVETAQQTHFDLIFMDMQMPVMSGLEAVQLLRNNDYHGPIVMLTANATLDDRNACKVAGSSDFLTKPINREQLYSVVEKYLAPAQNQLA